MAGKLTATAVAKVKEPGRYGDGGGLYLEVKPSGGKSWAFRFMLAGRSREMGLGPADAVTLAEAREKAQEARKLLQQGIDPLEQRKAQEAAACLEQAKVMTFQECAEAYIAAHEAGWRNPKHRQQWANTLATYAYPVFGGLPVQDVDLPLVLKVLEPIWHGKTETASRLRGRIESILDWATVRGFRQGENPARWRGHLAKLLPQRAKVQKVEHHAALPYDELPAFMVQVRQRPALAALALEFCILTATRTSETLGARWEEIDLSAAVWTIPGERMKAGNDHRVPLSGRALEILDEMAKLRPADDGAAFVFPGQRPGKPLSGMVFLMLLRRMERADLTGHGFRSTFRDWAAERTNYQNHVVESALAHVVGDKVEAAYRRGDLFEKRRRLMDAWAGYCMAPPAKGEVVPLGASR